MRKIEVDIAELIDVIYAGSYGELEDYLKLFMKKDCHITKEEIQEYAKQISKTPPYTEEDEEDAMHFADDW